MKLKLFLVLLVAGCSTPTGPACKISYPTTTDPNANIAIEATAPSLGDAEALAFRVINNTCGAFYPSRTVNILSENFISGTKQSTVRIQFVCVK